MSDDLNSLYRLTKADIKQASEIIAKAFIEKGDYSKIFDDPVRRIKCLIISSEK
jgi:hypothetical protein